MQRKEKKKQKDDYVKLDDIASDPSEGKVTSHTLLRAMIEKHPEVFKTRLYTIAQIKKLLRAYKVKGEGKKEELANQLVIAIKENISMTDITMFD